MTIKPCRAWAAVYPGGNTIRFTHVARRASEAWDDCADHYRFSGHGVGMNDGGYPLRTAMRAAGYRVVRVTISADTEGGA